MNAPVTGEGIDFEQFYNDVRRNAWAGSNILRGELPKVPIVTALPTASAEYRHRVVIVAGATTVADVPYACIKNDADTYEWMSLGGATSQATRVYATADETVNSGGTGSTLQDDNELLFAIAANTTYIFTALIAYTSGSTPDFKFAFTCPAAGTLYANASYIAISGSGITAALTSSGASLTATGLASGPATIWIWGIVQNGANAGNLQFQFAQGTSDAGNTTREAGSWLEVATA